MTTSIPLRINKGKLTKFDKQNLPYTRYTIIICLSTVARRACGRTPGNTEASHTGHSRTQGNTEASHTGQPAVAILPALAWLKMTRKG